MYNSVIHQNGKYAFGIGYYDLVLKHHSMVFKDYIALKESDTEQYDKEVQELIVSMLILKGSNHGRARTELQQQYAFGTMTDDLYPTTEEKVISLLDIFARNNNNNNDIENNISNNDNHDAVVAAHDASQDCYSDDDNSSDDESLLSYASEEQKEADATLLVNINESPTNEAGFRAMILANAVAGYDNGILEIEDNFINQNNNIDHQDLSGAFDDNEHDALACAHVVVIDGDDDNNDDFVVVDDPNNNDNSNNSNNNNNIGDEPIGHFSERTLCVTRDKVTAVYAVAVVVINKKFKASNRVHTINNIIEYADALICKFNNQPENYISRWNMVPIGLTICLRKQDILSYICPLSTFSVRSHFERPTAQSINRFVGITILS
jgi:hypothetical protein